MPPLPTDLRRWTSADLEATRHEGISIDSQYGATLATGHATGTLTAAPVSTAEPFAEAVASWQGTAPGGTEIEVQVRARIDGRC